MFQLLRLQSKSPLEQLATKYPFSYDDLRRTKDILKIDLARPEQVLILDVLCQSCVQNNISIIMLAETIARLKDISMAMVKFINTLLGNSKFLLKMIDSDKHTTKAKLISQG